MNIKMRPARQTIHKEAAGDGTTPLLEELDKRFDASYVSCRVKDAERGVMDAERGVTDAERGVTDAERGVTDADQEVTGADHGILEPWIKLKPICVRLAEVVWSRKLRSRVDKNLLKICDEFSDAVRDLGCEEAQEGFEFLTLPLFKALPSFVSQRSGDNDGPDKDRGLPCMTAFGDREVEKMLGALEQVVTICSSSYLVTRLDICVRILNACLAILDPKEANVFSEECLYVSCRILFHLFDYPGESELNSNPHTLFDDMIGGGQLHGMFAQIVHSLCQTSLTQEFVDLRLSSLETLQLLIHHVGSRESETVKKILPGVTGYLVRIMTSDFKLASKIRAKAISAWNVTLRISLNHHLKKDQQLPTLRKFLEDIDESSQSEDLKKICQVLGILVEHESIISSDNVLVRSEMARLCAGILLSCIYSVPDGLFSAALKGLVSFSNDTFWSLNVSQLRNERLEFWTSKVLPALESLAIDHINALPRLARASNEASFRSALQSCMVIFQTLKMESSFGFSSLWHDPRTIRSLVQTSQLAHAKDCLRIATLPLKPSEFQFPRHYFEQFREPETEKLVDQVLQCFGASCAEEKTALLADLAEKVIESSTGRSELCYIINQVLIGESDSSEVDKRSAHLCLGVFIDLDIVDWRPLDKCLRLEIMGSCFSIYGRINEPDDARRWLVRGLFVALEQIDASEVFVRDAALAALNCMAKSCRLETVAQLLECNIDYILDCSIPRLKMLSSFPEMPGVLQSMFELLESRKETRRDLLPFIADIVYGLLDSLDWYGTNSGEVYVAPLLGVLGCALRVIGLSVPTETIPTFLEGASKPHDPISDFIDEMTFYSEPIDNLDKSDAEDSVLAEDDILQPGSGNPDSLSPMRLSIEVVLRCRHFCSHGSIFVRRKALEALSSGILNLSCDREQLLPTIHEVWDDVVLNLNKESKAPILSVCFRFVACLIRVSSSFMVKRYHEDVWPVLSDKLCEDGKNKKELVVSMMLCAMESVEYIKMNRNQTILLADATSKYLESADTDLCSLAKGIWEQLCRRKSEIVWLSIMAIANAMRIIDVSFDLPAPDQTNPALHFLQSRSLVESLIVDVGGSRFLARIPDS